MRIFTGKNVFDTALDRINYLYDEFPNVVIGYSGGKDSTVTLQLALKIAEARGRLPVNVMWIDQEAEWQTVADHVKTVMYDPRVKPYWLQMPMVIFNATSTTDCWLHCWEEGAEWIREKDPISLKENIYGTDRFHNIFTRFMEVTFPNQKACYLSGVRTEESPTRFVGLTSFATYKHITWGKVINKKTDQYTFYPLYDWSYTDVWKAIHDNGWPYCNIYDSMYQQGVDIMNMRVSNVHHETAVTVLYYLQEIEGATWEKITRRIQGINTAKHLKNDAFFVKELPWMFADWREYRDYLLENLLTDEKIKASFRAKLERMDLKYGNMATLEPMYKVQISSMLTNDWEFIKIANWEKKPEVDGWRKSQRGIINPMSQTNKYIKRDKHGQTI